VEKVLVKFVSYQIALFLIWFI